MNDSLYDYMQTNFELMQRHGYGLSDLEQQLPWERSIYIAQLLQHLEKKSNEANQ